MLQNASLAFIAIVKQYTDIENIWEEILTCAWTISYNTEYIYQFNWILTKTRITSIRKLAHAHYIYLPLWFFMMTERLPLKELSHERSWKLTWILTQIGVISIRNLSMRIYAIKH